MIAINVIRNRFLYRRIELVAKPPVEVGKKSLGGPSFAKKEMLHARAVAALAQSLLIAKELGDLAHYGGYLVLLHEGVQAHSQVRIGGEATAYTQRESRLAVVPVRSHSRGQPDVIDLRIGAPHGTAGDGDLEFPGQVVKV